MKTKTIFLFIMVLLSISSITKAQVAPQNQFVYWENDQFMYYGEPFILKAANYHVSYHVNINGSDTACYFGPNYDCLYKWSGYYPSNQDSLNNIMHAHFKLIKDMGFNTVRVLNWVACNDFEGANLYLPVWDRYSYKLTGFKVSVDSCVGDCETYQDYLYFRDYQDKFFEASDKVMEIAAEYGLKVIWNCGAGELEYNLSEYDDFLDTISKRYANDTALFAYDFWAEPEAFAIESIANNSMLKRQSAFNISNQMSSTIKTNDKNHFTTIGTVDLRNELDFGFKSLNADFLNVHIYDATAYYYNLPDYATENILKQDIFWLKNNLADKEWLIGEVGMPGGDSTQIVDPPEYNGIYASWAEQNRVASVILDYSVACSNNGIVWFRFHDVNWGSEDKEKSAIYDWHDTMGCVSQKGSTPVTGLKGSCSVSSMNIFGTVKDIGQPTGAFNTFTTSTASCVLDTDDYRNPNHINNSSVYTGYVYNVSNDTVPVENAIVRITKVVNRFPNPLDTQERNLSFFTITDENGYFEAHTVFDSVPAQMIKVGAYGMTDTLLWGPELDDDNPLHQNHCFYLQTVPYGSPTTFPSDITISTNTTWDTGEDRWLAGNVTVASGATLTIKCEVFFLEGKGITVETGGRLNLNGGKLSSAGNDYLWNGVTINGNGAVAQTTANQGYIYMYNNAVIANAINAIKVNSGGICQVYHGSFINNKNSVYFYSYTNTAPNQNLNLSSIVYGDFDITGPLNNAQAPLYFAYLSSVKDIEFYNCSFTDGSANTVRANYRSKGIHAVSSTPDVSSTTFNGLYYGVYCSGGTPKVYNSTFENNFRGIYTGNSTNVDINNNTFDGAYTFLGAKGENIPNPPPYIYEPYSVYIAGDGVNNTVYKFEDNVIENGKIGSLFYNTGPNAVKAKGNTYSNITGSTNACAAVTIGKNSNFNSGIGGDQGLEFRCNTFNSNAYSLSIIDGNMRKYQGEYQASQGSDYAGNAFDHVGTNLERDFYVDQIVVSSLNIPLYLYYSHTDSLHNLLYFTGVKVSEEGLAVGYSDTHCSTSGGGGGGIILGMSVSEGTEILEQTDTEIMLKEFELDEETDNGNTNLLLSQTETMNINNSISVSSQVAALDGYISDEVAITFMQNNNCNQFAKANALLENSPLPLSVREEIDNLNINPTLKQIVKNQQSGVNNRDQKQLEIADLKQYRSLLVNEIVVSAVNNDSVPEQKQELKQFLNNDENIQSKFHLFNIYRSEGDFQNARVTIGKIKQVYQDNSEEFDNYIELSELILDIESGDVSLENAVEVNSSLLVEIASEESHPGQISAQLLLAEAGVEEYFELIKLPEPIIEEKSLKLNSKNSSQEVSGLGDIINVFPNPSSGTIYIEYAFLQFDGAKSINIFNMTGNLIENIQLTQAAGIYSYDEKLSPGNYIVKVGENFSQIITVQ